MKLGGLDIGTTGCKLSVYDDKGLFLCNAYQEYASVRDNDQQMIDPEAVWAAVLKVIREASAQAGTVDVIGVTSFGESFVLLDDQDRILMPAMLYTDVRGTEEVKLFDREQVISITGIKPGAMYSLPKIMWVKKHRPELYEQARHILLMEDFIIYKLTGVAQIDYSLASRTMAFDIHSCCWSRELLAVAGIDAEKLSRPVCSGTMAGPIRCTELSMPETMVVNGCHDQMAALIGAGVLDCRTAVDGTGTVECVTPVFDKVPENRALYDGSYAVLPHVLPGKYVCYAFSFTGGAALKWYRDTFAPEKTYQALDAEVGDKPTGILVLPHFAGAATPYMDNGSKAAFVGVTLGTSQADLYRAVMEGVTYEMLLNIEHLQEAGIEIDRLYATGGGANSPVWLQIKADILGRELVALDAPESGAAGTVMLCGVAVGLFKDILEARSVMVKERKIYYPDKALHEEYKKHYQRYRKLYEAVRPLMEE